MDRRKLHHIWTSVRPLRPRYLFIAALLCLALSAFALRANNLKMIQLRDAVYTADKNNGDVSGALSRLQAYVTSHMNTRLSGPNGVYPPIQLKYTYDRLRAEQSKSTNEQVYSDAQKYCEAQNPNDFSGRNRVPCIQEYVEAHGVQQKTIPQSLYKFDFVSPVWSPDLAGLSVLATILFALAGLAVWAVDKWFKRRLS
jgi:hypothetical protein